MSWKKPVLKNRKQKLMQLMLKKPRLMQPQSLMLTLKPLVKVLSKKKKQDKPKLTNKKWKILRD
jgi:hypothetical protein